MTDSFMAGPSVQAASRLPHKNPPRRSVRPPSAGHRCSRWRLERKSPRGEVLFPSTATIHGWTSTDGHGCTRMDDPRMDTDTHGYGRTARPRMDTDTHG